MQLTRRDLLAAGALGALAACTSTTSPEPVPVDPDLALLAAAVAREESLLAAYDDALVAHPRLSAVLSPLRAEHAQHLERLLLESGEDLTSPSPSATPAPAVARRDQPTARRAALAALERTAAAAHGAAAISSSRRIAPLLASLSACETSHVVVL